MEACHGFSGADQPYVDELIRKSLANLQGELLLGLLKNAENIRFILYPGSCFKRKTVNYELMLTKINNLMPAPWKAYLSNNQLNESITTR